MIKAMPKSLPSLIKYESAVRTPGHPGRLTAELITVDPSRVTTEQHREAGPIHVGYQFWQRLSLDRILHDCGLPETVRQLACAMVLNRLIAPTSEHAMPDWMRHTALVDILDVDFEGVDDRCPGNC